MNKERLEQLKNECQKATAIEFNVTLGNYFMTTNFDKLNPILTKQGSIDQTYPIVKNIDEARKETLALAKKQVDKFFDDLTDIIESNFEVYNED
jgi:hypothetical protein